MKSRMQISIYSTRTSKKESKHHSSDYTLLPHQREIRKSFSFLFLRELQK